jgi:hypothetical protein
VTFSILQSAVKEPGLGRCPAASVLKIATHDLRQESSTVHRLATSKWRESSIVGLAIDRDQAAR